MNEPAASRGKIWIEYSTRMDALIDDNKDEKDKLKLIPKADWYYAFCLIVCVKYINYKIILDYEMYLSVLNFRPFDKGSRTC